ncbi:fructose bisphosphate aldolase [Sphingomicrobium clamense]|uniref:Fructose bisphosphate aldolase n=1 Tax=Sphingomicrobium clamense TaxID=2851013 RepID=A0ABS6V5T9_9SPHN|nr:fructose bisphosphate aldolase [Sphingomicrobium sp. B8]MBW0144903.1 fructose bisphosphate aldolase [Sphingomicrobium sp. B8]
MNRDQMTAQIRGGNGFIAALDQSGGSTPKALAGYGVGEDAWSSEEEMFALIHQMRSRVITSPSFSSGKILGAILFERTMDGDIDGTPVPDKLKELGIVPFIKVDQGLAQEENGVQLMNPLTKLDALLEKSVAKGMFGTKMRSVINHADEDGIRAIVDQQMEAANRILDAGLIPIVEPEVNIKSESRAEADMLLFQELMRAVAGMEGDREIMLKLSLPKQPDLFAPLVAHDKIMRVVALSGGYSHDDAVAELKKNRGMIASFSRALLQDLRADMDDGEFDKTLGGAINSIADASAT